VTNALAQYPPFPHHLHSSLSPALSTPPISLSGSSYASTSSFASTQHEASQSSNGSYGAARINVSTSPASRPNNLGTSPGSPMSHGSSHGNKFNHAQPSQHPVPPLNTSTRETTRSWSTSSQPCSRITPLEPFPSPIYSRSSSRTLLSSQEP